MLSLELYIWALEARGADVQLEWTGTDEPTRRRSPQDGHQPGAAAAEAVAPPTAATARVIARGRREVLGEALLPPGMALICCVLFMLSV